MKRVPTFKKGHECRINGKKNIKQSLKKVTKLLKVEEKINCPFGRFEMSESNWREISSDSYGLMIYHSLGILPPKNHRRAPENTLFTILFWFIVALASDIEFVI